MHRFLTHAKNNTIAYIALFIALGGTSYAAANLPAGSVGTKQLHNGAVTSKKLAKHAVTAGQLDPKSISGHVALWAQIGADGHVIASSPKATVLSSSPSRGIQRIDWHRPISPSCIVLANPMNVAPVTAPATAHANVDPLVGGRDAYVFVATFDGTGANVPENVAVAVVCP